MFYQCDYFNKETQIPNQSKLAIPVRALAWTQLHQYRVILILLVPLPSYTDLKRRYADITRGCTARGYTVTALQPRGPIWFPWKSLAIGALTSRAGTSALAPRGRGEGEKVIQVPWRG